MTIRKINPDPIMARSLLDEAEREMRTVLMFPADDRHAGIIIKTIYDCFQQAGDALLRARGLEPRDHHVSMDELEHMTVKTPRPLQTIQNIRKLRNSIKYAGFKPSVEDTQDAIDYAKACWPAVLAEARKIIKAR